MRSLPRVLGALRPYWLITLGAAISLLFVTIVSLWTPLILRQIIDAGITPADVNQILIGALLLVGVALVRGVFSFLQGFWSEQASQGVAFELRNQLFAKIQNLSFSYHDQAQTGQLMTRITSDVEQVRTFISIGLLQSISAIAMLIGSVALLFSISWQLALVVLLTLPAMGGVMVGFLRIIRPLFTEVQQRLGVLNTTLQENLAGARVVQAFAREAHESERYDAANSALLAINVKALRGLANSFPLLFLIANLGTLAVVWIGGYQVIGGTLSLGELVAFNTYLALLIMPIMMLGMIVAQLARAGVSAERVFEILDLNNEIVDKPGAQPLPPVTGRVAFEQVSFGYGKRTAAAPPRAPFGGDDGLIGGDHGPHRGREEHDHQSAATVL
jgi:ATP-binding cassette, subfamily B, multidrug efflux pump